MTVPAWLQERRLGVVASIGAATALTAAMAPFQDEVGLLNEGLLFLLLTLLISAVWGREVGVFAAVVSNLALNFFFIEPLHRLSVQDPHNVVGLLIFLGVSVVGGTLLSSARNSAAEARRREAETQVLLSLSRTMIGQTEPHDALAALCREVVAAFDAPGACVVSAPSDGWRVLAAAGTPEAGRPADVHERAMAEQAISTGAVTRFGHTGLGKTRSVRIIAPAGAQRFRAMEAGAAFAPLSIGGRTLGVLRLDGPIGETPFRDHPESLLAAFASEAALGVQRAELSQQASHADALRQADEMKTALMTSISHDLKTPLAGIKTAVSSLLDDSVDWSEEDKHAFLDTIDSQADRLNRVISDILDLNRIESGVIAPALRPVEVRSLLLEVKERTAIATGGRVIAVTAAPHVFARADESLLAQALVNLVENAAKYSTPGGMIRLLAEQIAADTVIVVEDDGPGIAPQDLPHVFERFYRAQEQSRRVKGSGLGLAIVKGFVSLCGGTVRVESSPSGTKFVITLASAEPARATA